MALFVQQSDFESGELKISKTVFGSGNLQSYIDRTEVDILQKLLGVDLYVLFIADWIAANPNANEFSEQRFKDIFFPFAEDNDNCGIVQSEGIKMLIMYFTYFAFVQFQQTQNRTTGIKKTKQQNSDSAELKDIPIVNSWNQGVDTYRAIQWWMCEHIEDYPEENSQPIQELGWL